MKIRSSPYLTVGEVGERLGLHPSTVRWLIDTGRLPAVRTPWGTRLVRDTRVQRLAQERRQEGSPT